MKEAPVAPSSEGTAGKSTVKSEKGTDSAQKSINFISAISTSQSTTQGTPEVVKESMAQSSESPEVAAYEDPVLKKAAVEKEHLAQIEPENAPWEPAPKITSTRDISSPNAIASTLVVGKPTDPLDVSSSTVSGSYTQTQTQPRVTSTPTATTATSADAPATQVKSTTAKSGTPGSSKFANSPDNTAAVDMKKKRTSIFRKMAKFSDKSKD